MKATESNARALRFFEDFIRLAGPPAATVAAAKEAGAVTINYGLFLNAVLDFIVVAFVIFLVIRQANRARRAEEPAPARQCPYCFSAVAPRATRCPHCTSTLPAAAS